MQISRSFFLFLFAWLLLTAFPSSKLRPSGPDQKNNARVLVCAQRGRGHILQQNRAVLSCACSKPSGVHVCPRRSRPHSAAKQGRSFRVAALTAFPSSKLRPSEPGSKNGPSSARVCPKGSGPHSALNRAVLFVCLL